MSPQGMECVIGNGMRYLYYISRHQSRREASYLSIHLPGQGRERKQAADGGRFEVFTSIVLHFLWRRSCTPSIHRTRAIREERLGSYSILSYNAHRRSASFQINSLLQLLRSTPSVKGHWVNRTDATGNGILNGKNESDVRTGLTSVCQLLYFPISCPHRPPLIGALFPPIHRQRRKRYAMTGLDQ